MRFNSSSTTSSSGTTFVDLIVETSWRISERVLVGFRSVRGDVPGCVLVGTAVGVFEALVFVAEGKVAAHELACLLCELLR
jgi:hypothetical protein